MQPITTITSQTVVLSAADIDTDQIIPARFLTTTTRVGLGPHCFADWRLLPNGTPNPACPLNRTEYVGRSILVAGANFGCGSSREHAPWALLDYGFRAVISTRFADIFRANATRNGLLPIEVDELAHRWLLTNENVIVTIDLPSRTVSTASGPLTTFPFDPFESSCLMRGEDELAYLLRHAPSIDQYEETQK